MSEFILTHDSENNYSVAGDLTFFSLNKKNINAFDFSTVNNEILINLANINSADSAGLALIVEWIKQSRQYDIKITFSNIPQQLLTLAVLCDFKIQQYINNID